MAVRYLIITDQATIPQLEEAIATLRAKQRRTVIASIRDEINVNELIDMRDARAQATAHHH